MLDEKLETPEEEMQCPMKNQNSLLSPIREISLCKFGSS
jgi:hypothetical protein